MSFLEIRVFIHLFILLIGLSVCFTEDDLYETDQSYPSELKSKMYPTTKLSPSSKRFLVVLNEVVRETEELRYAKEQEYMIEEIGILKLILERSEAGYKTLLTSNELVAWIKELNVLSIASLKKTLTAMLSGDLIFRPKN